MGNGRPAPDPSLTDGSGAGRHGCTRQADGTGNPPVRDGGPIPFRSGDHVYWTDRDDEWHRGTVLEVDRDVVAVRDGADGTRWQLDAGAGGLSSANRAVESHGYTADGGPRAFIQAMAAVAERLGITRG